MAWRKDGKASFQGFSGHSTRPQKTSHCTLFRKQSVREDEVNKPIGDGRFFFADHGTDEALKRNPLRWDAGK